MAKSQNEDIVFPLSYIYKIYIYIRMHVLWSDKS